MILEEATNVKENQVPKYLPVIWTICALLSTALFVGELIYPHEPAGLMVLRGIVALLNWVAALRYIKLWRAANEKAAEGEQT